MSDDTSNVMSAYDLAVLGLLASQPVVQPYPVPQTPEPEPTTSNRGPSGSVASSTLAGRRTPEGRAVSEERKRELVEALLKAWLASPQLRLSQFVINAVGTADPFQIEDDEMLAKLRAFAEGARRRRLAPPMPPPPRIVRE